MKRFSILCLATIIFFACTPKEQKTTLSFNEDGTFKIMQLTDLHMVSENWDDVQNTIARINYLIEAETPDLIMITGDVVFGAPAEPALRALLETLEEREVPYACFYGNHDMEQDLTNPQMTAIYTSYAHCLNTAKKDSCLADEQFNIMSHDGSKPAFNIYGLDSHDYAQIEGVGDYAWITNDQVNWLRESCNKATEENGGEPIPSLMFTHIPIVETNQAAAADTSLLGTFREQVCSPVLNTGVFAAIKETDSIIGAFAGHDHDNDFITTYYGVALGYGRYSGGDCVYNHIGRGCRMFELKEGERGFTTWIRQEDGTVIYQQQR